MASPTMAGSSLRAHLRVPVLRAGYALVASSVATSGLGALLFGVFNGEAELRADLGIPERLQILGAIALGWPSVAAHDGGAPGLSANRPRRPPAEVIHHGGW